MKIRCSGNIVSLVSGIVMITVLTLILVLPVSDPLSPDRMTADRRMSEKNMNSFIDIRNILEGREREINYNDRIKKETDRAERMILKDGFAI